MLTRRSKIDMLRGQLVPAQIDDAYPERRDEIQAARCDFFPSAGCGIPSFTSRAQISRGAVRGVPGVFESDDLVPIINLRPGRQELHRAAV